METKDYIISEKITVIDVMKLLDKLAIKVLFLERNEKLVAAVTDGDIRRWILKNGSLDTAIKKIANHNPIYVYEKDKSQSKEIMMQHSIEALPVVNDDMKITAVISLLHKNAESRGDLNIPVIIMAGGLGTRLYPYTKILPKPLIPIGEIPISEHIINRFYKAGCDNFFMIVNHKKNMIKAYYNELERDYSITYIDESTPLGTGGGLSLLKGKVSSTFILSNCDILIEEDYNKIYKHHKDNDSLITIVCSLKHIQIPYGVIDINESGEIENMREKPKFSYLTNTGMYVVEPKVIEELEENTAIGFPDIIEKYRQSGEKISIYPISEQSWQDMGQIEGIEAVMRKMSADG